MSNFDNIGNNRKNKNIFNIFKYIVLVFAFVFVGIVANRDDVRAESWYSTGCTGTTKKSGSSTTCVSGSGISDVKIRIDTTHNTGAMDNNFKICSKGSSSTNCKELTRKSVTMPKASDLIIERDTGDIKFHYLQVGIGTSWTSWVKIGNIFSDVGYFGTEYETKGFRIDMYGGTTEKPAFQAQRYTIYWSAYIDVGAYYFNQSPVLNDLAADDAWAKSHSVTPTISNSDRAGTPTIWYAWSTNSKGACTSFSSITGGYQCKTSDNTAYTMTSIAYNTEISANNKNDKNYLNVIAVNTLYGGSAGQSSLKNTYRKFDNTNPELEYVQNHNYYSKSHEILLINPSDDHSGVEGVYYCYYLDGTSECDPQSSGTKAVSEGTNAIGDVIWKASITGVSGMTGKYFINAKTKDKVGNWSENNWGYAFFDNTAPTATYTYSAATSWSPNVTISNISSSDAGSGVENFYYCWSNNSSNCSTAWVKIGSSTSIKSNDYKGKTAWVWSNGTLVSNTTTLANYTFDGEYYFQLWVIDDVGWSTYYRPTTPSKIDNIIPTAVTITYNGQKDVGDNSYSVRNDNVGVAQKFSVSITGETGNLSEYKYAWKKIDESASGIDSSLSDYTNKSYEKTSGDGTYQFCIVSIKDKAGNAFNGGVLYCDSNYVTIDNTKPVINKGKATITNGATVLGEIDDGGSFTDLALSSSLKFSKLFTITDANSNFVPITQTSYTTSDKNVEISGVTGCKYNIESVSGNQYRFNLWGCTSVEEDKTITVKIKAAAIKDKAKNQLSGDVTLISGLKYDNKSDVVTLKRTDESKTLYTSGEVVSFTATFSGGQIFADNDLKKQANGGYPTLCFIITSNESATTICSNEGDTQLAEIDYYVNDDGKNEIIYHFTILDTWKGAWQKSEENIQITINANGNKLMDIGRNLPDYEGFVESVVAFSINEVNLDVSIDDVFVSHKEDFTTVFNTKAGETTYYSNSLYLRLKVTFAVVVSEVSGELNEELYSLDANDFILDNNNFKIIGKKIDGKYYLFDPSHSLTPNIEIGGETISGSVQEIVDVVVHPTVENLMRITQFVKYDPITLADGSHKIKVLDGFIFSRGLYSVAQESSKIIENNNSKNTVFKNSAYYGYGSGDNVGTVDVELINVDNYYGNGSQITNYCNYLNITAVYSGAICTSGNKSLQLTRVEDGGKDVNLKDIYNIYGVKAERTKVYIHSVNEQKITLGAFLEESPDYHHYMENKSTSNSFVYNYYVEASGSYLSAFSSGLKYKIKLTDNNTEKDYPLFVYGAADTVDIDGEEIYESYKNASDLGGDVTTFEYQIVFRSGLTKKITMNVYKYDSTKLNARLLINNYSKCRSGSTATNCILADLYKRVDDDFRVLVLNFYVYDNNSHALGYVSTLNSQFSELETDPFGGVSGSAGDINNNIVGNYVLNYSLNNQYFINRPEASYTVTPMVLASITNTPINLNETYRITLKNSNISYVPLDGSGDDANALPYECDDFNECVVTVGDGGVPNPRAYFNRLYGHTGVKSETSVPATDGVAEIGGFTFTYDTNNEKPTIDLTIGILNNARAALARVFKGNTVSLTFNVLDDDNSGVEVDASKIKVNSTDLVITNVYLHSVSQTANNGMYSHTFVIELKYNDDTTANDEEYTFNGVFTFEKGAIKDKWNFVSEVSSASFELSLVPIELQLVRRVIKDMNNNPVSDNQYTNGYYVELQFNREIANVGAGLVSVNGNNFTCSIDNSNKAIIKCTMPTVEDGTHEVKFNKNVVVTSIEDVPYISENLSIGIIKYDTVAPTISLEGSVGSFSSPNAIIGLVTYSLTSTEIAQKKFVRNDITYIIKENKVYEYQILDTKHRFSLAYNISDTFSGVSAVNASVKVGNNSCESKSAYENGVLTITDILCGSTGDVVVQFDTKIKDRAGNELSIDLISSNAYIENGEVTILDYSKFITINNTIYYHISSLLKEYSTKDVVGSVSGNNISITLGENAGNYTISGSNIKNNLDNEVVGFNQAYIKKYDSLNVEVLFSKEIKADSRYVIVNNANKGTLGTNGSTLVIPIVGGTTSDVVDIELMPGAAYYEIPGKVKYEVADAAIDPQIEVLSGNYRVEYQGIENNGCVADGGKFYCNAGDVLTFSFEANRVLSSSSASKLKLNNGAGGAEISGVLDNNNKAFITYTYTITSSDTYLDIASLVFSGVDMAGNTGTIDYTNTRLLKTDLGNYVISTSVPDFSNSTVNEIVYLGDSYATLESNIIRRYSSAANYVHEFSLKDGAKELVLMNGDLFGEVMTTTLLLTRTDKAGNSATLTVNLSVQLGGEIIVEFKDLEKTFDGNGYTYNNKDISVTLPRTLQVLDETYNGGKLLAFIKSKITGKLTSGTGIDFGNYQITADGANERRLSLTANSSNSYSSSYLNGNYTITIEEGTYKVNKARVTVSVANCVIVVSGQEYNGSNGYNNNFTFVCNGVASDEVTMVGTFKLDSSNVGEGVSYTISDIRVSEANTNYESVGTTAVLSGTTNVTAQTIDISEHLFNEIVKYYDGNNNVLVKEGKYSFGGKEFTIRWDSATYKDNYTCESVCEDSEVVVILVNPRIVSISSGELTTNYVISKNGTNYLAKGKLIKDEDVDFDVSYYKENEASNKKVYGGEIIETNKNINFDIVNLTGNALNQSGVTSSVYKKEYYLSATSANVEDINGWTEWGNLVVSSSTYIYIRVTNPSGISKAEQIYVDYVSGDMEIESIFVGSIDEEKGIYKVLSSGTYVYKLNSVIVVGFKFNKVALEAGNTLTLNATDSQGKYTFEEYLIYGGVRGSYSVSNIKIDDVDYSIDGENVLDGATVVGTINGNSATINGIRYVINGSDVVVDGSYTFFIHEVVENDKTGNNLTIETSSMSRLNYSDKYGNKYSYNAGDKAGFDTGYSIKVDRASAGVQQAQINLTGLTLNSNYVSDKMVKEADGFVYLLVLITFTEEGIISAPDKVYLKNASNPNFELMIPRNNLQNNYIAFIGTISAGDLANITGNLQISYFAGNNSKVYFESRTLDLTASEVNSALVSNIYVDNELFTSELKSTSSKVKDSVVIDYTCNKECNLTAEHVNAILTTESGDSAISSSNISIDSVNKKITITGLTKGTLKVSLKDLTDKVNNVISSNTVTISADNENMVATGIAISGCSDCTTGNTIIATVAFNKNVVTPGSDIKLNTSISGVVFNYSRSYENKVEFTYTVNVSDVDEDVTFTSLSSSVYDALDNGLTSLNVSTVPVTGIAHIDTKMPGTPSITSKGNNCSGNICGKDDTVTVTLTFDEEIERHNNISIKTNFGDYTKVENVNVKSTTVAFTFKVKDNAKVNSFIITELKGNFYDAKGNSIPLSLTSSVHTNSSIRLDSVAPKISSIALSGCNNVDEVMYCKAGSTISVVVTTSETLSGISTSKYPKVTLTFDSVNRGTFANSVVLSNSNKTITYTYTVGAYDSGSLTKVAVDVNGFSDAAGNALSSVLPTYNTNIVVDNTEFTIELRNISQDSTTASAIVRYYCSKTRNVECVLTGDVTDKFNVLVAGTVKEGVAVTAGVDEVTGFNILTVTGLIGITSEEEVTIQAKGNIISDYAGNSNGVSKESLVIGIDTSEMEIAYDHYAFGVTSDCSNRVCVEGNELTFTIPFNKVIKEYDSAIKLNITIGIKEIPLDVVSKSENILRFKYIIQDEENGDVKLVSLTGGVVTDKDGNTSNASGIVINEDYVNTRLTVDTRAVALDTTNGIVASSTCENGLCKLNDKVSVTLTFDEKVYKYSNVVIETNFGNYASGNNTVTISGETSITFDVNISVNNVELSKFVITKITGNFFDAVDNGFALSLTSNVYENNSIKLDSKAPTISDVDVSSCNFVNESVCNDNSKVKANDKVIVVVTFSEPLSNKDVVSNRAAINLLFDTNGEGSISWIDTDGDNFISYVYTVSSRDSGALRNFSLSGGYLTDVAGNAAVLAINPSVIGEYDVIVDNIVPIVTNVAMNKKDSETGVSDLYLNKDDVVKFDVIFSEETTGTPTLNIKIGNKEINGLVGIKNADGSVSYEYTILDSEEGIIEFVSLEGIVLDNALNTANLDYVYGDKTLTVVNSGYNLSLVRKGNEITATDGAILVYSINTNNEYSFDDIYNKIKDHFVLLCKIDGSEFEETCIYKGFEVGIEAGELNRVLEVRKEENKYNIYLSVNGSFDDAKISFRIEYDDSEVVDIAGNPVTITNTVDAITYDNERRAISNKLFTTGLMADGKYYLAEEQTINVEIHFNNALSTGVSGARYDLVAQLVNTNIIIDLESTNGVDYTGSYTLTEEDEWYLADGSITVGIKRRDNSNQKLYDTVVGSNGANYTFEDITDSNLYYDSESPTLELTHNHINDVIKDEVRFTLTCSDGNLGHESGCGDIVVRIGEDTYEDNNGEYIIDVSELVGVVINYSVKDKVGNESVTYSKTFIVDRIGPYIDIMEEWITAPITSGNVIEVSVDDELSELEDNASICYTWRKSDGSSDICTNVTLVNGKARVNVPSSDGVYVLVVNGAKDALGNTSIDYESVEITIDNSAPTTSQDKVNIDSNECVVDNDVIYCGKVGQGKATLSVSVDFEDVSKIDSNSIRVISDEFDIVGLVNLYNNKTINFKLRVKDNIEVNKDNLKFTIVVGDVLNNASSYELNLTNVKIDVVDDVNITFELDNYIKKLNTKIKTLNVVDNSAGSPISYTCELRSVNGIQETCDINDIMNYEFVESRTLTIKYTDLTGNSGSESFYIEVDSTAPTIRYEVYDENIELLVGANSTYKSFSKNLILKLKSFSEDSKYSISYCSADYSECSVQTSVDVYAKEEVSINMNLINDIEYIKIQIEDIAGNINDLNTFVVNVLTQSVTYSDGWAGEHSVEIVGYQEYSKITYTITKDVTSSNGIFNEGKVIFGSAFDGEYKVNVVFYLANNYYKNYGEFTLKFDNSIDLNNFDITYYVGEINESNIYRGEWVNQNVIIVVREIEDSKETSGLASVKLDEETCELKDGSYICVASKEGNYDYKITLSDIATNSISTKKNIMIDTISYDIDNVTGISNVSVKEYSSMRFEIKDPSEANKRSKLVNWKYAFVEYDENRIVTAEVFDDFWLVVSRDSLVGVDNSNPNMWLTINNLGKDLSGRYTLYVYACDEANNKAVEEYNMTFDNEGPAFDLNLDNSKYYRYEFRDDVLFDLTRNVAAVSVSDGDIGLKEVSYSFVKDGVKYDKEEINTLEGIYTLIVKAYDKLNNEGGFEITFLVDNVGPHVVLDSKGTNSSPVFTIIDLGVGIEDLSKANIKYCIYVENAFTQDCDVREDAYEITNEGKIKIKSTISDIGDMKIKLEVQDDLGNVTNLKEDLYYDNIAPVVSFNGSVTTQSGRELIVSSSEGFEKIEGFTNEVLYVTISIEDLSFTPQFGSLIARFTDENGVVVNAEVKQELSEENGKYYVTYIVRNNGSLVINIKDKVGNETTKTLRVDNINRASTIFSLSASDDPAQSKAITINLEDKDNVTHVYLNGEEVNLESINNVQTGKWEVVVNENRNHVIKVVNKWGNVSEKTINVTSVDNGTAPEFVTDFELELGDTKNGEKLLKEVYADSVLVGYEVVVGSYAANNNTFVYNKGTLRLVIPTGSIKDSVSEGFDTRKNNITIKLCYNANCTYIYDVNVNGGTAIPLNNIFEEDLLEGNLTYQIIDAANNIGAQRSLNIRVIDEVISSIDTTIVSNHEGYIFANNYSVTYTSDSNGLLIDAVEYYFVDEENKEYCKQVVTENISKELVSGCLNLDGVYDLKYKITDKLGNVFVGSLEVGVLLDTVVPVNDSSAIAFEMYNNGTGYYFHYNILADGTFENSSSIEVLYEGENVCTITDANKAQSGKCNDIDDSWFDEFNKFNFETRVVDKAGNISVLKGQYSLEYNDSRRVVFYDYSYDVNAKAIVITFNVVNPENGIKAFGVCVYNGSDCILNNTLTNKIKLSGNLYKLELKESDFDSETDGFIDEKIIVSVFDYYTVEDPSGIIGSKEYVIDNFDTNDPIIDINVTNNMIIKTNENETYEFEFDISNKDMARSDVRYIIQRTTNVNGLETVTKENFIVQYSAVNVYTVAKGVLNNNVVVFKGDSELETGIYRLIIYVEDLNGNKSIASKSIKIDNTAPVIKIHNINNIDSGTSYDTYTTYNQKIWISAVDNMSNNDTGILSSVISWNGGESSFTGKITVGDTDSMYEDGEYVITIKDKAGNIVTKRIIVDTENNGFSFVNGVNNDVYGKTHNLSDLYDLYINLNEEMRIFTVTFKYGTSSMLTININKLRGYCRYQIAGMSERTCLGNYEDVNLNSGSKVSVQELLSLVEGFDLSTSINQLVVEASNVSGIKKDNDLTLDFVAPVIKVSNSISGQGLSDVKELKTDYSDDSIICTTELGEVNYLCRGYTKNVIVTNNNDAASGINTIVSSYISIDKKSYQSIVNDNDRLIVKYYSVAQDNGAAKYSGEFNPHNEQDWYYYVDVLKYVGDYIFEYNYTDEAGNEAKPVFLLISVVDNTAPTIHNVNNINLSMNISINEANSNTYKVLKVQAKDNYGFDIDGLVRVKDLYDFELQFRVNEKYDDNIVIDFVEENGELVGKVDGIKYVVMNVDEDGNVIYTFVKEASYHLVYSVKDYKENMNSIPFRVSIEVNDKYAPIMSDEVINIENDVLTIKGVEYALIEDGDTYKLVDGSGNEYKLIDDMVEINDDKYIVDFQNKRVYPVLNINYAAEDRVQICFEDNAKCEYVLNKLQAYDNEDEVQTVVYLGKILHSSNINFQNKNEDTSTFVKNLLDEGYFRVESIKLTRVGYYKIIFYSEDSKGNRREVEYIVLVEDNEAPKYYFEETLLEGTVDFEEEYDEDLVAAIKSQTYKGKNEEEKLASYVEQWVKKNIKVRHNYAKDENITYTFAGGVVKVDELKGSQDYLVYQVKLLVKDSSGNERELIINYRIKDTVNPTNGDIQISYNLSSMETIENLIVYTNASHIYFKLNNGSDITGNHNVVYEYKIVRDGYILQDWTMFAPGTGTNGYELGYAATSNEIRKLQIVYRVKDSVGNISVEYESALFIVDKKVPTVNIEAQEDEVVEIEEGTVYQGDKDVVVTFIKDAVIAGDGVVQVRGYRNNRLIVDREYTSNEATIVNGFGHYKFVVKDKANNEIVKEFIIIPSDNTFTMIDGTLLNNAENAAEETKQFDQVIIQKLTQDGNSFYFEDMSVIGNNDAVYFLGVVPDKAGAVFSIYASGAITGETFKQYETYFSINTSTNITNINPNYKVNDYIINLKGEKYILIGIVNGAATSDDESGEKENTLEKKGGANFTWIFYILGGAGAVGGVFLIMKLRKRVRAA